MSEAASTTSSESASAAAQSAVIALLLGGVAIGLSPIFVRLSELGPAATAFHRVFLAVPLLWIALRFQPAKHRHKPAIGDWFILCLSGFFFAGDLAFWHWSIHLTSVANATLFANFNTIFVTAGALLFFGERITGRFILAMALTIAGALILMSESLTLSADYLVGDFLGVVCGLFYACYFLAIQRLRARFSTAMIMTWSGAVTALFLLPLVFVSGESLIPATLYGWAILLGLSWISHLGGQGAIAFALAHLPASFSSVSLLVQPLLASIFGWIILSEPLSPVRLAGGVVILVGIYLARRASARS